MTSKSDSSRLIALMKRPFRAVVTSGAHLREAGSVSEYGRVIMAERFIDVREAYTFDADLSKVASASPIPWSLRTDSNEHYNLSETSFAIDGFGHRNHESATHGGLPQENCRFTFDKTKNAWRGSCSGVPPREPVMFRFPDEAGYPSAVGLGGMDGVAELVVKVGDQWQPRERFDKGRAGNMIGDGVVVRGTALVAVDEVTSDVFVCRV